MDESAREEISVACSVGEGCRLSRAERPSLHLRTGESSLAEPAELGKIAAGLDDVELGVCPHIREAELVNVTESTRRDCSWLVLIVLAVYAVLGGAVAMFARQLRTRAAAATPAG